ncbi:hypothetical protein J6590_037804 [Homalodisca vitripennis]|nr:hypothetical protein J6590_037804 [Homalodisca vitripennis]
MIFPHQEIRAARTLAVLKNNRLNDSARVIEGPARVSGAMAQSGTLPPNLVMAGRHWRAEDDVIDDDILRTRQPARDEHVDVGGGNILACKFQTSGRDELQ